MKYVSPLQPDLMRHALPLCLRAWQQCLFGGDHEDVARAFHSALFSRPTIIAATIGGDEAEVVKRFMGASIIARMSAEHSVRKAERDSSAHTWLAFFASYGCVWPDIGHIYDEWRSLRLEGFAVTSVQYLSLLAYDDREQPLFPHHSPSSGGGAPRPWDYAGDFGDSPRWLPENVEALSRILTVESVQEWACAAARKLSEHPERHLADLVCEDIGLQPYRIESRIHDLVQHMASEEPYKYWSDSFGMSPG